METGTAGLYVAGHGFQAGGVGWKGRRKKSGGEGRGGVCVGFCSSLVYRSLPPDVRGNIFCFFFMDWEGGWDRC